MFIKEQIASVLILCNDQKYASHSEWLRNFTAQMEKVGSLERAWNGKTEKAHETIPDVYAWIDSSRWIASCPFCGHSEGVDPKEAIFFCMNCDMEENEYMALPVIFPDTEMIAQITALLMERPVKYLPAPTKYERVIRQIPLIYVQIGDQLLGLGRNWMYTQSLEDLRAEQDAAIILWKEQNGL